MKKLFAAMLAASMFVSVAGCSGDNESSGQSTSDVTTSAPVQDNGEDTEMTSAATTTTTAASVEEVPEEIDYSKLSEQEIYDLMVERSLITTGDTSRMANVLSKAQNGEEITCAYIGGSITEGYHDNLTLKNEEKWVTMSTNWLGEQFPSAKFNCVNAGISGTPSVLGNVRLERDVLAHDPDIVFVEFAVNDGGETIYKEAYESMVRTLLADERDIAVVLLFTIVENGHTCQPHMSQIGERYNLPMISLPDSIWVEMQEGRMTWRDYSGDGSHPHVEGSKFIRDFVINYYENVIEAGIASAEIDNTLPEPVFSGDYMNMHFLDSTTLKPEMTGFAEANAHGSFPDSWQYRGETGASMKFTLNCRNLAMVFKANNSKMYGDAIVYVDGEKTATVSSNMGDGWQNPVTRYIFESDECAEHEIEIVVEGKAYFGVLAFGYNE